MSLKRSKLLNRIQIASLYGLGQTIPMVAQLVISLIIIKKHSTTLWGAYVTLLLWVNFIIIFSYFGNKNYLLKQFSLEPRKIYTTWLSNFYTRFLVFLIIGGISLYIPLFKPHRIAILIWMFLLFYNQSYEVIILYQKAFKFNFYVELFRNIIVIFLLVFASETFKLHEFLYCIIIGLIFKALCYSFYYRKLLFTAPPSIDKGGLLAAIPFPIPMVLGTLRTKIDSYYGTIYFSKETLSEYQIFISLIAIVQLGIAYMINPFIKIFYRISKTTRMVIETQFLYLGLVLGLGAILTIYGILTYVYGFYFSMIHYILGYLFIVTLCVHLLLINEFYKNGKQVQVAYIIGGIALLQIILGYFIIDSYQSIGALLVKVIGQWLVLLALMRFRKQFLIPLKH